jgi:hypothetical protein
LPLADDVVGCALGYVDGTGATIPVPAGGLGAADRARATAIVLDVSLKPATLTRAVARTLRVALRR